MNTELQRSLAEYFPQFEPKLQEILLKNAVLKKFKAGEVILRSGEYFKQTVLVTGGVIKLYTEGEEGEEFFMYHLEPGQACALSFVCATRNRKSDVQAIAMEDSEAILLPIGLMDNLMQNYKTWYYFVLETYRNRYHELLDVIRSVAFNSMDERLVYYLAKQKNATGQSLLHITHEQIAIDLNSSRVVISRLLKQLENKGKVRLNRNSIEVL
jgi:CRP/FNR family transcriptional regulator